MEEYYLMWLTRIDGIGLKRTEIQECSAMRSVFSCF